MANSKVKINIAKRNPKGHNPERNPKTTQIPTTITSVFMNINVKPPMNLKIKSTGRRMGLVKKRSIVPFRTMLGTKKEVMMLLMSMAMPAPQVPTTLSSMN